MSRIYPLCKADLMAMDYGIVVVGKPAFGIHTFAEMFYCHAFEIAHEALPRDSSLSSTAQSLNTVLSVQIIHYLSTTAAS